MYTAPENFDRQLRSAANFARFFGVLALLLAGHSVYAAGAVRAPVEPTLAEVADYEAALQEAENLQPDSSKFEYLGSVDIRPPWVASLERLGEAKKNSMPPQEPDVETKSDTVDTAADLMEMITLDGRIFRQRPESKRLLLPTQTFQEGDEFARALAVVGGPFNSGADAKTVISADDDGKSVVVVDGVRKVMVGGDSRKRSTTKSKQGVMVKLASTITSKYVSCSASMISPRIFLTAAHCITDGNGDWDYDGKVEYVIPSARGASYSGDNNTLDSSDRPWGSKKIIVWIKPSDWNGKDTNAKYDYALLVIKDYGPDNSGSVQWKPAPAYVKQESCAAIDYSTLNLRGYPGYSKSCADASSEDSPKCGGYAYYENAPTKECFTNYFVHKGDSEDGQSGSPMYQYSSSSGKRTVVGVNLGQYATRNWAHRIRSGSMGLICDVLEDPEYQSSHFVDYHCD